MYSLGLTGWFLLTGRPAFGGPSVGAVLNAQMNAPLPSLAEARPDLPASVHRALARMCAKDPAARPASMEEVVRLLEALRPRRVRPAVFATRAAAFAADVVVIFVVAAAFESAAIHVADWTGASVAVEIAATALWVAAVFALQWGLEARLGASVGKLLFGLRVVREDGAAPSRRALAARFLLRLPSVPGSLLPVGLLPGLHLAVGILQLAAVVVGAAWCAFTGGRTLSDVLTRTCVGYRDREFPAGTSSGG